MALLAHTGKAPSVEQWNDRRDARGPVPPYHIIVGESTPQTGGMCVHMKLLADGLAENADVHVWSPDVTDLNCQSPRVKIHRVLGRLNVGDFLRTGRLLNTFPAPRRLMVYWVPHAYGPKAMNLALCLWMWFRAAWRRDQVELLVQECFLPFAKDSWRRNAVALVHRLMTIILLRAPRRVWIALPEYEDTLRPYTLGRRIVFKWLPVPSNVAVVSDEAKVKEIRSRLSPQGFLIGHFGTFGRAITDLLEPIVVDVLQKTVWSVVLLGSNSEEFRNRLLKLYPELASRVHATGYLDDATMSCYLSACDVVIQPYPEGLTARRGSALAPLAHGRPLVTNATERTEALWKETRSVLFAPMTPSSFLEAVQCLAENPSEAKRLSAAARQTYLSYFDPAHMIRTIQSFEP